MVPLLKRRAASAFPRIRLKRDSRVTLQAQLREGLRAVIAGLAPGARLPSTRALAESLGLSRNTVLNVYEELALEGLLTSRTGSGTCVSGKRPAPVRLDLQRVLSKSHYPTDAVSFCDPDGHPVYLHR